MIGQTLGHYRVLERIGSGGMGVVYRAQDTSLGRDVALKLLPNETIADATARERLLREARNASALNHPSICTIHEVGEDGGQVFIAMELVEGLPLSEIIGAAALPTDAVLRYGSQIADALAHAHQRRLVHRDLKSLNIMVTPEGRIKVLDFGLARRVTSGSADTMSLPALSLTQAGSVVGTPQYLAPEVLRGQEADARSDLWALGVVLYEMSSGSLPFVGSTMFDLAGAILQSPPLPLPTTVPAGLRAVIARCLEKDPNLRYQIAREVHAALEVLRTHASTPLPVPAPSRRVPRASRLALSFLALATVGAVVWLALRRPWESRPAPANPSAASALVAVLPFTVRGDPALNDLREGMVGLLGNALDGAGDLRSVEAPVVLAAVAKEDGAAMKPERARRIARRLGAEWFVLGDILGRGGHVRIEVGIYDASKDSRALAHATAEGPATELTALTEDAARGLLAEFHPGVNVASGMSGALVTKSLPALKAYLQGEAALRGGDFDTAQHAFQRAVEADSSLAVAWYQMSEAQLELSHFEAARLSAERAAMLGSQLSERQRVVLDASRAFIRGDMAVSEQLYRRALDLHPEDLKSWQRLTTLLAAYNSLRGRSPSEAREPAEQVIRLDPGRGELRWHLASIAYADGQMARAESLLVRAIPLLPDVGEAREARLQLAGWRHNRAEQERIYGEYVSVDFGPRFLLLDMGGDIDTFLRINAGQTAPPRPMIDRLAADVVRAMVLTQSGRRSDAERDLRAAHVLSPLAASLYGSLLACCLTTPAPATSLDSLRTIVGHWSEPPYASEYADSTSSVWALEGPFPLARLYLLGLLSARLGDGLATEHYATQLDRFAGSRDIMLRAHFYALGVRAALAWQRHRVSNALALLEKQPIPTRPGNRWGVRSFSHERFMRAEALFELGRTDEALGWFDGSARPLFWDVMYLPDSYLRRAEIHEQAGHRELAAEYYRRVAEMRKGCDPEYRAQAQEAARASARLLARAGATAAGSR
ncbi:MAG: protein kinase [Candidatus Eisenbacteria bacterium]